ncbi:hypothetical protein ABZ357_16935 [Streptomyces sp. NPDC005917]|uniref:hypothetical protein n=1 Tax=unclassified Streptomyces TaxID=2593676 RepID=UPI0033D706F2
MTSIVATATSRLAEPVVAEANLTCGWRLSRRPVSSRPPGATVIHSSASVRMPSRARSTSVASRTTIPYASASRRRRAVSVEVSARRPSSV